MFDFKSSARRRRLQWVITGSVALLAACGGGLEDPTATPSGTPAGMVDAENDRPQDERSLMMAAQALLGTFDAPDSELQPSAGQLSMTVAVDAAEASSMDGATPDMVVQAQLSMGRITLAPVRRQVLPSLSGLSTSSLNLMADSWPSPTCRLAFLPPARLTAPAPVAAAGLLTMDAAELTAMRRQLTNGPFLAKGDFLLGSPDEMDRLKRSAAAFLIQGEVALTTSTADGLRPTHGSTARDAAFLNLLAPSASMLSAVRAYLISQARTEVNDFSTQLCLRNQDGSVRDAWYGEASWLARYIATYDAVRAGLGAADRLQVENFIRRNAYFLAAQLDYGFNYLFPKRAEGNYAVRGASAAAKSEADQYVSKRQDTNGDCRVNAADDTRAYPVYAYARADGSAGPRLSVLSQWYNNRKSVNALAIGMAGALLQDHELVVRGKRYFMEWLTYGVYPDGSEGEYIRNGDYCVVNQGLIYAASNVQGAALLADILARRGDNDLIGFSTRDGLFGSASAVADQPKSLAMVAETHLDLATGKRTWYWHRGDLKVQRIDAAQHLGRMDSLVFGTGRPVDSYHQLGLLLAAKRFPAVPIRATVLRDRSVTALRWPGSTGNAVATGFGSWAGAWTDAFNIYPSALLLREP